MFNCSKICRNLSVLFFILFIQIGYVGAVFARDNSFHAQNKCIAVHNATANEIAAVGNPSIPIKAFETKVLPENYAFMQNCDLGPSYCMVVIEEPNRDYFHIYDLSYGTLINYTGPKKYELQKWDCSST